MGETVSPAEIQFNQQVANSPVVKEIIDDLDSLKKGQANMEDRMESLENKVDSGFKEVATELKGLAKEIRDNKEKELIDANKELSAKLSRKNSNGDKIKNGSITGLILLVSGFLLDKLGYINSVG